MKRNVLVSLAVILAMFAAVPSWAASPFGQFGGKVGGGNVAVGPLPLFGWALDDGGIAAVDILVDGLLLGRATYGRSRPNVTAQFPGFPDSAAPGWVYQLDSTRFLNGRHTVSVRARSKTGETTDLNSRVFTFNNTTHSLAPFGDIEFPKENAELFGACNPLNPRRYSVISGWALDAGVQADDHGVGYVELLIDRSLWANSKVDCIHDPARGGLSDCYGLRRLDIARIFPSLRDNPHSGFRFVLDVGLLLNLGYTPGHHLLTIRSGDVFGTVRNIAEIPVTFDCAESLTDNLSIGDIDVPLNGLIYSGVINSIGWALDYETINSIVVLVDGEAVGNATYGLSRPGISSLYPGYPNSAFPGWRFALDTRELSNGRHQLQVIAIDNLGNDTLIGERSIEVRNPGQ